jgi:hypothetical protein
LAKSTLRHGAWILEPGPARQAPRAILTPLAILGLACLCVAAIEALGFLGLWLYNRLASAPIPDPKRFLAEQSAMLRQLRDPAARREALHPVLGWIYRPEFSNETDRITTQGLRSTRLYAATPAPGVHRIALFGDSYAYANEVSNEDAWPARLEAGWRAEVLNYGVGGYGVDQALLRFRQEGMALAPATVLLGFTTIMTPRTVSRYRRFQNARDGAWFKPRFVMDAGALRMLPPPVANVADVDRLLATPAAVTAAGADDDYYVPGVFESTLYRWSRAYRILYYVGTWAARQRQSRHRIFNGDQLNSESTAFQILLRLFDEFDADVRAAGADFVVLMLGSRDDVELFRREGYATYEPLRNALAARNLRVLEVTSALAASQRPVEDLVLRYGHYSPVGNEIVAQAVAQELGLAPGAIN